MSRILNGDDERFPDATRQRVLQAPRELEYLPSMAGRSLKSGRSDIIAVLLPDSTFASDLQDAIDALIAETGLFGLNAVVRFASSTGSDPLRGHRPAARRVGGLRHPARGRPAVVRRPGHRHHPACGRERALPGRRHLRAPCPGARSLRRPRCLVRGRQQGTAGRLPPAAVRHVHRRREGSRPAPRRSESSSPTPRRTRAPRCCTCLRATHRSRSRLTTTT